ITTRRDPLYQAVIGPGREQSVILGTAGALSVALSGCGSCDEDWQLVHDLYYPPAGGGMLTLIVAGHQPGVRSGARRKHIARRIFDGQPFTKLIVFTDTDVDIRSAEDVLWAMTTRSNLVDDCVSFGSFRPLRMDPSQTERWSRSRGGAGCGNRSFIDATVPF